MDTSYVLFIVLVFVAIVLAIEGAYLVWASRNSAESKRIAMRLQMVADHDAGTSQTLARTEGDRRFGALDAWLANRLSIWPRVAHFANTSGVDVTAAQLVAYSGALAAGAAVLALLLGFNWIALLLLAGLLAAVPWLHVSHKRQQRVHQLELQVPEALDLMGRALRAGHAFPTAIKMVAEEMSEPIAGEFRQLFDEANYGADFNGAMLRFGERVPVDDLRYFVIAVLIQRETGGNLTELLDNIAAIVRDRLRLLGEVRTLSAEGRLSAWILCLMPFVVAGFLTLLNPKFMRILWTDPAGVNILAASGVMMVLGVMWMRKIIRIRV